MSIVEVSLCVAISLYVIYEIYRALVRGLSHFSESPGYYRTQDPPFITPPVTRPPVQVLRLILPPAPQVPIQVPFDQAQVVQFQRDGRTIWQPTPTVDTFGPTPLNEAWIATAIEAPRTVEQGKTLVLRVEVSNNHRSKPLRDRCMLEVEYPSSVLQVLGPEPIKLEPEGDTTLIYFQWTVPYLPGNYILRFLLLNHQVKTEKALIVT